MRPNKYEDWEWALLTQWYGGVDEDKFDPDRQTVAQALASIPTHTLWHFHKRDNRRGFLLIDPQRITRVCKTSRCTLVMVEKMQRLDDYFWRATHKFPEQEKDD